MNKEEAHRLLNEARAGLDVDRAAISAALVITGDMDDPYPIVRVNRPVGSWEGARELSPATWCGVLE